MKGKTLNKRLLAMFLAVCLVLTGIAWSPSKKAKAAENVSSLTFEDIKGDNESSVFVTSDLALVQSTGEGDVTWTSSDESVIANDGKVTRPAYGSERKAVTMTATVGNNSKAVGVIVAPQGAEEETNLPVDNYNFEKGSESDVSGWALLSGEINKKGQISISKDTVYEGNGSMKIAVSNVTAEPYSTASLGVRSGYTYTARVMLKGNVESSLILRFFDMHGDICNNVAFQKQSGVLNDWTMVSVSAVAPAGAVYARLSVCTWGTGALYADSVSLYEEALLPNATFAYDAAGWTESDGLYVSENIAAEAGLEYVLQGQAKADGKMTIKFLGAGGKFLDEQSVSVSNGETKNIRTFAPAGAETMKVSATKDAFSEVKLYPAATGTQVSDGSFESFGNDKGSDWDSPAIVEEKETLNGDFEDGIQNWYAYTTDGEGSFQQSTEKYFEGNASLKVTTNGKTSGATSGAIPVEAGNTYKISGKYFSTNSAAFTIYVNYVTQKGYTSTTWGTRVSNKTVALSTINQWTTFEVTEEVPADAKYVTILLYYYGNAGNVCYLDNIEITEINTDVFNGDFEAGAENWNDYDGRTPVQFEQTTTTSYTGNGSLKITTSNSYDGGAASSPIKAEAGITYRVTGRYQSTWDDVFSVYLNCWSEAKYLRSDVSSYRKGEQHVALKKTADNEWGTFSFDVTTPEGTKYVNLLVYIWQTNGHVCYLDNVEITKLVTEEPTEDPIFEPTTEVVTDGDFGAKLQATYATSKMISVVEGHEYETVVKAKSSVAGGAKLTVTYFDRYKGTAIKTYSVTTKEANKEELLRVTSVAESVDGKSIHAQITLESTDGVAYFDGVNMYAISDSVSNASFEDVNDSKTPGTFPTQWRPEGNVVAKAVSDTKLSVPNGVMALEVLGIENGAIYSSMIRANVGTSYTGRVMARTQEGGSLQLVFFDGSFNLLSTGDAVSFEGESWKRYTAKATAPDGTEYVALKLVATAGDCYWVDSADMGETVIDIGSEPQLFIDDYMIANMSGFNRTFHQGEKSEPLTGLGKGLQWASYGPYVYGSVIYDEDENIYKMWYAAYTQYGGGGNDANAVVNCYATSKDGINWKRPNLGLVEFNGSKDNNIIQANNKNGVSSNLHIASVMKDYDEVDPNKRYKMTTYLHDDRYSVLYSADGLNWSAPQELFVGADVINSAYDDTNDKYFAVLKDTEGYWIRRHYTITSDDFDTWNAPVAANSLNAVGYALDSWGAESYGQGLYERGGAYIGFNWLFMIPGTDRGEGTIDVRLTYSRDLTEEWQIPTYEPIIPLGEDGTIDDGMIFTASSAIEVGDEVWMYCGAWDGDHRVAARNCDVYVAKWRLDGFASLDATDDGQMETKPFTFEGNELRLNADATDGQILVELVDASGNAIEGFTKNDCTPITSDSVKHAVSWNGSYDVSELEGEEVSIRIYAENSEVYSFQFTDEITVEEGPATDELHVEELNMSDYQNKAVPLAKVEGYEDWIFAGWYTDETCENAVESTETSGTYYAKFVPSEILSVWCQTLKDTTAESQSSKLRLMSLVDTLNYEEVGFKLKVGEKELQYKTKSVSSKITAGDVEVPYVPTDFNPLASYFTTVTLTGFTNDRFDDGVRITPYWITLDGTTVEGVARYARIEDSYKKIINVPVRITSDELVSKGSLEVVYDSSVYEYYPNEDGTYDLGNVFTAMNITSERSTVICDAIVGDGTQDADAKGLYVNLRFKVKAGASIPGDGSTFAVIRESFKDSTGADVDIDVPNVFYKNIQAEKQEDIENPDNSDTPANPIIPTATVESELGLRENLVKDYWGNPTDAEASYVTFEEANINKPAGSLDAGNTMLKLTNPASDWWARTGIYFSDKLNDLSQYNDNDYFILWAYFEGTYYNSTDSWCLFGTVDQDGIINESFDGQKMENKTTLVVANNPRNWVQIKFTVAELKEILNKQGNTSGTVDGMLVQFNFDAQSSVYLYSVEYHPAGVDKVESRLGYQGNTADSTWGESYCSKSYVTFEEAGVDKPSQALDAGDKLLKLTTSDWEARTGIYFSEKLKDLNQYDNDDYFVLWMYFESEHWNNEWASYGILGNINSEGKFDADQSGQQYSNKTSFAPSLVQKEWIPFKLTVGELKAMLNKQGNTSRNAEWMFISLNFQQNTSVYLYSVEYHKASTDFVESQLGLEQNIAEDNWDITYDSRSSVTFEEVGLSKPTEALDAGDKLLKLTTTEWTGYTGIYFSSKLKDLSQYDDDDYFILWMYFEGEHWNQGDTYCILGNAESGVFNLGWSGQTWDVRTEITPSLVQKEWIPMKFTVGELKNMLSKQGLSSAEWMFLSLNFHQNTSVFLYSVEYHKASN